MSLKRLEGIAAFKLLVVGQSLSQLGSGLTAFAVGVWIYQTTGSVGSYALFHFFGALPRLIALPLVGSLVDRWDRRKIIIAGDSAAGVLTLILALLFLTGRIELWHIYAVVIGGSMLVVFQRLGFAASISSLVPKAQLGRANGMAELGNSASMLLAPLIAGSLLGILGIGGIIAIDFVTLSLAVVSFAFVIIPRPKVDPSVAPKTMKEDLLHGMHFIRRRPGLLALLGLFAVVNFAMGMVQVLITPMVLSFASEAVLGAVVTAAGLGIVAGGLLMSAWGGPKNRVLGILGCLSIQGVVLGIAALQPNAWLIGAAAFVFLGCFPVLAGCSNTIWQTKVPSAEQGRVFSVRQMLASSMLPLAFLASGPLADDLFEPMMAPGGLLADSVGRIIGVGEGRGLALMFIILGALLLFFALVASRVRRIRNLETDLPDAPDIDAEPDVDSEPGTTISAVEAVSPATEAR